MKQQLDKYKGPLTSEQIAAGMNAATRNAARLANDARIMHEQSRHSTAVGLAILSIEESGKHAILREIALARNQDDLRARWREYRQHTSKNQLWLLIDSALKGASKLGDFAHLYAPNSEHPHVPEHLKQISLYTDCFGNQHWSIPDDVIDANIAKMLVGVAELLSNSHVVTSEEIELWITHMQPVYKTSMGAMECALIAWDKEMRTRGLLNDGPTTMEDFIMRGIDLRHRERIHSTES